MFIFVGLDLLLFEVGGFSIGLGFRGSHSLLEFSGSCSTYMLIMKY